MAQGVHCPKSLLEGQAAFQSTHHHLRTRIEVPAIGCRVADAAPDTARAVEADSLRRRIDARREERLDAMRQRIEPSRCGQPRRQSERQLRIADGALRDKARADEA